ncbi:hypothetical protein [uncultured Nevskia sp.]|uniref:hypothetical protein n=1 Tax=uncultured Nevskia sp. TaxID=228950 RepID=UPI0025DF4CB6|nr:hypothetical protein [uncultured Nevskia sp.]
MTRTIDQLAALHRQLLVVRGHCEVLACTAVPAVAAVFARLATAKAELAGQLAQELNAATVSLTVVIDTRRTARLYRRWLAMNAGQQLAGDSMANSADVAALVVAEDRLLHRCEQLLASKPSLKLRQALKRYVPQVEACHAELRRLHVSPERAALTPVRMPVSQLSVKR